MILPGECLVCEHKNSVSKQIPIVNNSDFTCTTVIRPNGLFQTRHYSPEREKYWVEKDPKICKNSSSTLPRYPRLATYNVNSTHHQLLENHDISDKGEYIPSTSQRRLSFENMKLTKQFGMDCPSDDDENGINNGTEGTNQILISERNKNKGNSLDSFINEPKTLLGNSVISRTGTKGLQRASRLMVLNSLYMKRGSLCSAEVKENIAEEGEQEVHSG